MNYKFVEIPTFGDKSADDNTKPKEIFDGNNFILIAGKPGDGKSTLISLLLRTKDLLANKYHKILFITPGDIPMIEKNESDWMDTFDFDWLMGRLNQISD